MMSVRSLASQSMRLTTGVLLLGSALLVLEFGAGCTSTSDKNKDAGTDGGSTCESAGGPVSGADDTHCTDSSGMAINQATTKAACTITDAGAPDGDSDAGAAEEEEAAPTLYGSEGDDDDCKYHLKWSASCVEQDSAVTFKVHVTKREDGTPLTGAGPMLEVYLNDMHTAPNTDPPQSSKETAPGDYTIGPVKFDASGKWTVRFHLYGNCADVVPESPHGHAAFFLNVP